MSKQVTNWLEECSVCGDEVVVSSEDDLIYVAGCFVCSRECEIRYENIRIEAYSSIAFKRAWR